jgi:hypothetical protein
MLRTGVDGGKSEGLGDSGRLVVSVRGDEPDEKLAVLCARHAEIDMVLLEVPAVTTL